MKKRTNLQQFFDAARAMMGRIEGQPSGDRTLDALPLYAPTGITRVEEAVQGLTLPQVLTAVLTDWWLGGVLTTPHWPLRRKLWALMLTDSEQFTKKVTDLPTLHALGTVELTEKAPWTRHHYSEVEKIRRIVLGANHHSMETVFEALTGLLDQKDASYAIRVLRPFVPVSTVDWVWVTPQQGCGLAWATTGRPHAFHPVTMRQEEARRAVLSLVEAATIEANWPAKFRAFNCDAVLSWSDYMWAYLKLNYQHLKDPVA